MADKKKITENRRKLLKTVAAGGGAIIAGKSLPKEWSRPVVDSVMLPAHAATSHTFAGGGHASIATDSMFAKAVDGLIPPSYADGANYKVRWCITPTGETTANVYFLVYRQDNNLENADLFSASDVEVGPTPTSLTGSQGCSNLIDASAGEWLNNLGLVRDAEASYPPAEVKLTGLEEGDRFRLTIGSKGINFVRDLIIGSCGEMSIFCPGAFRKETI